MPSFWEKVQVDGQDMDLYASVPSGSGPFPAVVVAMHGGGVDRFIQTICDRLAEEGYAGVLSISRANSTLCRHWSERCSLRCWTCGIQARPSK